MHASADRLDFAPPPPPGLLRSFGLAVLAHVLLVAALMHGLQWKRETQNVVAEAELWSAVPQQAAPREVAPPPPPPPPPAPVVQAPPPPPVVKAPPQPEPPVQREPDIALEREKARHKRELERRELERREAEKREIEKREIEKQKLAEQAREREQRRKLEAQKKQREEELARKKEEQARLVAEAKRKEEAEKKKRQEQEARDAKRMAQLREENLRRIQGMADKGAPDGTAARSSGPSASWGARVQARVKPNIVFSDDAPGNPEAVVEVRLAPDGTIVNRRIKKSSGNRAWDEAVLRALDRTEVLPRDTDGRVPPAGELVFRPRG